MKRLQPLALGLALGLVAAESTQKQARNGWVCPNGNSFESCGHDCKYMYYSNGALDLARERQCAPEVVAHSPKFAQLTGQVEGVLNSCGGTVAQTHTPCNQFAGMAMSKVFGVQDFNSPSGYMSSAEMHRYLKASAVTDKRWQPTSGADAQVYANLGQPAIAVTSTQYGYPNNHVAVVLPGATSYSYKWQQEVPVVAAAFQGDPTSLVKCMPCFANDAFGSKAPEYYVRNPGAK